MCEFIIFGVLLSISMGGFMALILTSGMNNGWGKAIITTLVALAIGFGITGLMLVEKQWDTQEYNNGICSACDGEYELIDVEHHRNGGDTYYYKCDKCGNLIQTNSHFN